MFRAMANTERRDTVLLRLVFRFGIAAFLAVAFCTVPGYAQQDGSGSAATSGVQANATSRPGDPGDGPDLMQRNPRYQLSRDDVLSLKFPLTPEFDQVVTVQPDGFVTLLDAGELQVAGETVPQVTAAIQTAYAHILHNPVIMIQLQDFEKPYFVVGGQVGHPGKYDLRGETTIVQGIEIAGGFTDASKHSQVWLFRRVSDQWVQTEKINVKNMLRKGDLKEDVLLHPGDMVYVPKNRWSKIARFIPTASLGTYMNPIP